MDDKILAIPYEDPMYNSYQDLPGAAAHISDEISHFFRVYKLLEPDKTTRSGQRPRPEGGGGGGPQGLVTPTFEILR